MTRRYVVVFVTDTCRPHRVQSEKSPTITVRNKTRYVSLRIHQCFSFLTNTFWTRRPMMMFTCWLSCCEHSELFTLFSFFISRKPSHFSSYHSSPSHPITTYVPSIIPSQYIHRPLFLWLTIPPISLHSYFISLLFPLSFIRLQTISIYSVRPYPPRFARSLERLWILENLSIPSTPSLWSLPFPPTSLINLNSVLARLIFNPFFSLAFKLAVQHICSSFFIY